MAFISPSACRACARWGPKWCGRRLLSLTLGATVYTFSIILAVFLTGLGIGSGVGAFWGRRVAKPRVVLGTCQILIAGAVAFAAFIINWIPYWPINPYAITKAYGPWIMFLIDILRTTCAVLPAAVLWGASFPLALASMGSRHQDPGRMVGSVYAANTVGAILGSLLFSMLIIPRIGTQNAHRLLILLPAVSALIAVVPFFTSTKQSKKKQKGPAANSSPPEK